MKNKITTFTLAILAILLFGINQSNAQAQRKTNNSRYAFFNPMRIAMQPNYENTNKTAGLGKKITKQRLDSVVSEKYNTTTNNYSNESKNYYTYDFNGRVLTYNYIIWNDTFSTWQNSSKRTSAYNAQGYRTLSEEYDTWNRTTNQWQYGYKYEYTFDNNGYQTSNIQYNWDMVTQAFSVNYKTKTNYIFNSNGKPTISYDSNWSSSSSNYAIGNKEEYTYDASGNITLTVSYNFDGTTWNPSSKTEYTYHSNNKVLVQLQSRFSNNNWVNSYKYEYTYDSNGNETTYNSYNWNTQTSSWEPSGSKVTNTYDANNNQTSRIYAYWNSTTKLLENEDKNEFVYDGNGNLSNVSSFTWDKNTNQWVSDSKFQYNYNNSYAAADIVWDLGAGFFKHMVTDGIGQKWVNNAWVNEARFTAYYSPNNFNGLKENTTTSNNIFPNPTSGLVTISSNQTINNIQVFDVTGKLVQSIQNNTNSTHYQIDLSTMSNGIYFINIETESGEVSKSKIVISK